MWQRGIACGVAMSSSPRFSVVVPTCHRNEDLALCLDRLAPGAQTLSASLYEVIVTDDGRTTTAEELVAERYPWAQWTQGPQRGPGANRNHGAKLATGEWLVFVDDDCLPEPQWLDAYAIAIDGLPADDRVLLQGPTIRMEELPSLLWEAPQDLQGTAGITANFATRRADYMASGGIDERYRYAFEDTEFFSRQIAREFELRSVTDAIVHHPIRRRPGVVRLAQRWEGRVVYALDQGALPWTVAWRLPLHVARVIQSRFRDEQISFTNAKAALLFAGEWMLVTLWTPGWIIKWARNDRSAFWSRYVVEHGSAPKYGF